MTDNECYDDDEDDGEDLEDEEPEKCTEWYMAEGIEHSHRVFTKDFYSSDGGYYEIKLKQFCWRKDIPSIAEHRGFEMILTHYGDVYGEFKTLLQEFNHKKFIRERDSNRIRLSVPVNYSEESLEDKVKAKVPKEKEDDSKKEMPKRIQTEFFVDLAYQMDPVKQTEICVAVPRSYSVLQDTAVLKLGLVYIQELFDLADKDKGLIDFMIRHFNAEDTNSNQYEFVNHEAELIEKQKLLDKEIEAFRKDYESCIKEARGYSELKRPDVALESLEKAIDLNKKILDKSYNMAQKTHYYRESKKLGAMKHNLLKRVQGDNGKGEDKGKT